MLFFDLCSCLPDSYCGWQPEGTVLQRESGMTGGLMRDVSLLLQCPLYLPRSPCRDRQEVREGRRWGQGKLCYAVWWLCNAVSPSRDLSQCSSALQGLPAPDTSSYFTRMHRTQAVQEIGCNRFVVILRKKKTNNQTCVKSACLFILWNGHMREPSPSFTSKMYRLSLQEWWGTKPRPSLSPLSCNCAVRNQEEL